MKTTGTLPQMRQRGPAGSGAGAVQFFSHRFFCKCKNSEVCLPQLRLYRRVDCPGVYGEAAAVYLA